MQQLTETVIKGVGRARNVIAPTVNTFAKGVADGLYYCTVSFNSRVYNGLAWVINETAETHIFEFDMDIYGQQVVINLGEQITDDLNSMPLQKAMYIAKQHYGYIRCT